MIKNLIFPLFALGSALHIANAWAPTSVSLLGRKRGITAFSLLSATGSVDGNNDAIKDTVYDATDDVQDAAENAADDLGDSAKDTSDSFANAAEDASENVAEAAEGAKENIDPDQAFDDKSTWSKVKETAGDAKDYVQQKASNAKDKVKDMASAAKEKAIDVKDAAIGGSDD
jgi:gas vesicle protein